MAAVTSEKIVWIAVPWAVGPDSTRARVSILVSPRLEGPAAMTAWSLGSVPAASSGQRHCNFIDWPEVLRDLVLSVRIGDPANPAAAQHFEFPAPSADATLWARLFGSHTPVAPFAEGTFMTTTADAVVRSYSPRAIADLVRKAYVTAVTGDSHDSNASAQFATANADGDLQEFLDFHAPTPGMATSAATDQTTTPSTAPSDCESRLVSPDDRGRLIVVERSDALPLRPVCYVLPAIAAAGAFTITFRNALRTPFFVRTADGTLIDDETDTVAVPRRSIDDDRDVAFRVVDGGWQIEHVRALDFHEAVSALSAYPQLMRRLGLLFDVELPFTVSDALAQNGWVSVIPVDHPNGCSVETRSISPWTAFATATFDGTRVFSARPDDLKIERGLLQNVSSRHHLVQIDVDGAGLQMRSHASTSSANAQIDDPARSIAPSAPTQPPAFRHGGYALIDEEMEGEVRRAVTRRQKHESDLANGIEPRLYADDLIQGYRIDAARDDHPWRSLCARHGEYAAGHDETPIEGMKDDEGHVSLVADQSQNGDLRISRSVFRWDGWSLAVPRPMKAIDDGGNPVENTPRHTHATFPLKVAFTPVPGSLQRLRFTSRYVFRARAVDLAGNALRLEEADAITGPALTASKGLTFSEADGSFDRFEPVDAPVVAALQPPGRNETADVLVIRQSDRGTVESRGWLVLPPKTSQTIAEKHGVLDRYREPAKAWKAILERDGEIPGGTTGSQDQEWIARHRNGPVPYFADPMARGAALHAAIAPGQAARVPFFVTDSLQARPFRLMLRGGSGGVAAHGRELAVALPEGRAFEVGLSSYVDPKDAQMFAPWRWLAEETPALAATAHQLAESGQLPGVTPPRKLTLVHAVQRPLVPDGGIRFYDLHHTDRKQGEVTVSLLGEMAIDVPSTARLDMQAEWTEMVDDPAIPAWDTQRRSAELFPNNVGPNGETETVDCQPPAPSHGGFPICGSQTFVDTHHRKVRYRAHAVSRFAGFYPEAVAADRANISRVSADFEIHIPSTAAPAVPEIAYVVPAFKWNEETPDDRTLRTTRVSLFRVYLKRGWFSSGDDEMAAVILAPAGADMAVVGEVVTEWGVDPIWKSTTLSTLPVLNDFPPVAVTGATVPPCVDNVRRTNVTATLRREQRPDGTLDVITAPVDLAAYPVALDAEKNLLYFDVAIDTHGAYFPFVRLALARYQPCSIEGLHLSQVVRAVFTQATPERTITVRRTTRDLYEVVVAGPSYAEHAPKPKLSLGRRASMELTLERKESGLGRSNMDWFPIADPMPLTPSGDPAETMWSGAVKTRWLQRDAYHRIVVKEYEHFYADPLTPGGPPSETRRLVFAHAMPLDEI